MPVVFPALPGHLPGHLPGLIRALLETNTVEAAKALLGCLLARETPEGARTVVIVETEAYLGVTDDACHSYGGRRTPRTEVMYGPPGRAYVYRIYGIHDCLNIVTRAAGVPEAVLIRAAVPVTGLPAMMLARFGTDEDMRNPASKHLADGPGKLCRALGIDRTLNGHDLAVPPLQLSSCPGLEIRDDEIHAGPRIGIPYASESMHRPWRFRLDPSRTEPLKEAYLAWMSSVGGKMDQGY